jgi:cell division protein FtsB
MESDEKDSLQLRKLTLEIAELERPWWMRPTYILAALPTLLAVVALSVGFLNGFFSAQLTKLDNQRFSLEQQIREFESRRDQLHRENEQLANDRDTYKDQVERLKFEIALKETIAKAFPDREVKKKLFELAGKDKRFGKCMDANAILNLYR